MAKRRPSEMPFLDHLEELRWRLVWSIGALGAGMAVAFLFVWKFDLIKLLIGPIEAQLTGEHKLVYTHSSDPFSAVLQTSFALGVVLAAPVIIYQICAFLSPALHRHEKHVVIPAIIGSVFLFACGAGLAWFLVLPMTFPFLLGIQSDA